MISIENVNTWTNDHLDHLKQKLHSFVERHNAIHYVKWVAKPEQRLGYDEMATLLVGISGNDITVKTSASNRYQLVNELVHKAGRRIRREFARRSSIRRRLRTRIT